MPALEERPTSTSEPAKPSFLASDAMERDFSAALAADGKLSPTAPPPPSSDLEGDKPPVPAATDKPGTEKPATDQDEMPAEIKSPASKDSWKKLKESKRLVETERDTIKSEREALRAELEQMKKTATTKVEKANLAEDPEYIALKRAVEAKDSEAKELSERLRILAVERHPKFEAYFKQQTEQTIAAAQKVGGDRLVEALKLPESEYRTNQLKEIASEMDPLSLSRLGVVLDRLENINYEKQSEINRALKDSEALQAQEQQESARSKAEITSVFNRITKDVTDKENGLAVFREREGDEEWNKGVRDRLELAKASFEGRLKPDEAARQIYWASAAPTFLAQNNALMSKVAELEKQIVDLRSASPSPGGGTDPANREKYVPGLDGMMLELEKVLPGGR